MNSSACDTPPAKSQSNFSRMALLETLGFILINFATPIVFYITFRVSGAKPAIAFAVGATLIQTVCHWIFSLKFSPFFLVASGFTVVFGLIDLFIQSPQFFRMEPAVQNFVIATVLLGTLNTRIPVITRFVSALPKNYQPDLSKIDDAYLRHLTIVWIFYLYFKAVVFFYLALKFNLGELIVLRSVIGGVTLFLLAIGEIIYRKCFRRSA